MKQGLRQPAKKGKWSSGPPPFGYDLNRDTGYLEIDLEEAEVVRQIFRTYHNEAIGIRKIARRLNAQGPRTSNGNQFLYSTLQQMLTNPVYRGKTRHNEDIEVEGGQEAIIEDELFSAVQERFNNTRTLHPRRRHSKLLLAGIAKCRTCDKLLRTHHKNENDSFYRCSGNTGPHSRRGDS